MIRDIPFREMLLLALITVLATYFGVSLCYQRTTQPEQSYGLFKNIARDGWVVTGSMILPPYLAGRGNRMHVDFHDWRPDGLDPAHLRVYLCGELIDDFVVTEAHTRTFFLTGECQPRVVRFEVVNPFRASPTDERDLGIQIKEVRIDSRLGYPILQFQPYLNVFLAIFSITVLWYFCWFPGRWRHSARFIPILGFFFVQSAIYMRLFKIYPVWLFFLFTLLGVLIARLLSARLSETDSSRGIRFGWLMVAIIVAIAGALRFYGLNFGLPSNFHPDEVPKVNAVMRMVHYGDLNPRYFLHPSLLLYLTYLCNASLHWLGVFQGEFRESAFLAGRIVSALSGTLSVLLLYFLGRRLFNPRVGLIAAALLAVFPLHITSSRYLKEDALLLFFILACALAVVKAVQEDKKHWLLFAGLLAGFSASVKYSGLLTLAIVGCAPWLRSRNWLPDKQYLSWTFVAALLFPIAFLIGTPYSVLNYEHFIDDFRYEKKHMQRGHTIAIDAWSQYWTYHLERSIIPGMTHLPAFLGLIGIGICLWRRRVEDLFILGLILLYYLPAEYVRAKPAPQPERYIYPCLPFLALAGAVIIDLLARARNIRVTVLAGVVAIFAVLQPAYRSITLASEITDDTRDQMARWMRENLPHGSNVYIDLKAYNSRFFKNEFKLTYARSSVVHRELNRDRLQENGQQYLLLSSLWWDRYFSQPRSDAPVQRLLREVFQTIPIKKEFVPRYGSYGFHNPIITLFSLDPEDIAKLDSELGLQREGKLELTSNEKVTAFYGFKEQIDY